MQPAAARGALVQTLLASWVCLGPRGSYGAETVQGSLFR